MAQEEKKRGFFARFRKSAPEPPKPAAPAPKAQPPVPKTEPPARVPEQLMRQPESIPPQSPVQKPVSTPFAAAEEPEDQLVRTGSGIDPFAAFQEMCQAFVDINRSQVKAIDMTLTMLSEATRKIVEGPKKQ
jgi:hypothetical protein